MTAPIPGLAARQTWQAKPNPGRQMPFEWWPYDYQIFAGWIIVGVPIAAVIYLPRRKASKE